MKKAKDYLIVCFVIITSILIFIFRKDVAKIGELGYIGIFMLCFLSNLTVFLPAPSLLVVMSYSQILSPILVCVIGAIGTTIGELSGYLFGNSMGVLSEKWKKVFENMSKGVKNIYIWVFVFALIPLPLFDFVGVYAGVRKFKLSYFFIACYIGKLLKMIFFAFQAPAPIVQ